MVDLSWIMWKFSSDLGGVGLSTALCKFTEQGPKENKS